MLTTERTRTAPERLAFVIESEFREMPGMRLTFSQVRRLWNLSPEEAVRLMNHLQATGRIRRDEAGRYCLSSGQDR